MLWSLWPSVYSTFTSSACSFIATSSFRLLRFVFLLISSTSTHTLSSFCCLPRGAYYSSFISRASFTFPWALVDFVAIWAVWVVRLRISSSTSIALILITTVHITTVFVCITVMLFTFIVIFTATFNVLPSSRAFTFLRYPISLLT